MSTGVQITLIICLTLIAMLWILGKYFNNSDNSKKK